MALLKGSVQDYTHLALGIIALGTALAAAVLSASPNLEGIFGVATAGSIVLTAKTVLNILTMVKQAADAVDQATEPKANTAPKV